MIAELERRIGAAGSVRLERSLVLAHRPALTRRARLDERDRDPRGPDRLDLGGVGAASVITSCTSSRSQMRANATWPIFELSAATMTWRARSISARLVCASTSWWVVNPAWTSIPSTPITTRSRFRLGERRLGERADQLVGLGPGDAAGHDQLQVGPDGQLGGDAERVGDDREPLAVGQRPRHLGGRGAAGHADGRAVRNPRGRRPRDPGLLLLVAGASVAQRQLVEDAVGDRAAVGAVEQPLLLHAARGRAERWRPTRRARRPGRRLPTEPSSDSRSTMTPNRSAWRIACSLPAKRAGTLVDI